MMKTSNNELRQRSGTKKSGIKKNIFSVLLAIMVVCSLSGCEKNGNAESSNTSGVELDVQTKELRQNDYRGGIMRTQALQNSVIKVMEAMKANNKVLRQDSPNSFWTAEGYQDFVSTFLDIAIINDTQWFNEEETDWAAIMTQIITTQNSFSNGGGQEEGKLLSGVSVTRNEKDDYSVTGVPCVINAVLEKTPYTYSGNANYCILYDCDKDWCKAYATMSVDNSLPVITASLFEYQRVDANTFIIQTSRERLMVVLAPAESDTDIRNREVKEFYYSKLVAEGQRTTFTPYEPLPEEDEITKTVLRENEKKNEMMATEFPVMNAEGDLCSRYGEKDSMFYRSPNEIGNGWVFEDKALQQGIVYKEGILIVTTYNKLSGNYERFIYSRTDADTTNIKVLEDLVEIENLVGIQSVEINAPTDGEEKGNDVSESTGDESSSMETASDEETSSISEETSSADISETSSDVSSIVSDISESIPESVSESTAEINGDTGSEGDISETDGGMDAEQLTGGMDGE